MLINGVERIIAPRSDLTVADLYGADLARADLSGADLTVADLSGADLRGADLTGARLYEANLTAANLSGADLRGADLRGAYLRGADLRGARLYEADLRGADLTRADLTGADLSSTCLIDGGQRSDGWRFIGAALNGALLIHAGCRSFPLARARAHWSAKRAGTPLGDETFAILDHIETVARIRGLTTP